MDLQLRMRGLWDDLQASLWYRPALYIVLALILALINPYIDQITGWKFYSFGADNARAILSAIASSMLTVVTLTFSILMVAFTLASQQFSPRILRNFTRDRTSQHVLGLQIGTFLYSLLVMVRINEVDGILFVPLLSVLGAIGFSLVGIGAFVYFIDHISRNIRVNYIIANIGEQTVALLSPDTAAQVESEKSSESTAPVLLSQEGATVKAPRAGYIQGIDYDQLVELAQEYKIVIEMVCMTGDFVVVARPLLQVYPANNLSAELTEELLNQFDIGIERTLFQDTLFGIRQLVDIALKALSPAVNDPTTAINCIDSPTNILIQASRCAEPTAYRHDSAGQVRLLSRQVNFVMMVELAFNQIRYYGSGDILVDIRMIDACTEIANTVNNPQWRALLWEHICIVSRSANRKLDEPHDRQQINECLIHAARQMGYSPTAILLSRTIEAQDANGMEMP